MIGLFLPLSIIPLFIEAQELDLFDNRIGYILLHVEPGLPLGVVLLTGFIAAVPRELDEAAWSDGCGYLRYLLRVIAPLTWSGLLITFLYSMLGVWNDIIGPGGLPGEPGAVPDQPRAVPVLRHQPERLDPAGGRHRHRQPADTGRCSSSTQRYFIRSAMGGAIKM